MQARLFRSPAYLKVELSGAVELNSILQLLRALAAKTREFGYDRAMVDVRGLDGELNFTGHFLIGEHVAQHLSHLAKLASVAPADKITRTSEKVAQSHGVQLRVFDNEGEAVRWLEQDEGAAVEKAAVYEGMDAVRSAFWEAFRPLFPPHAQAVQIGNGSLVISWSVANDPSATYEMSTPITVRFEPELIEQMRGAAADQRKRIVAVQEQVFRAGLVGYDPYAAIPKARVIVLG